MRAIVRMFFHPSDKRGFRTHISWVASELQVPLAALHVNDEDFEAEIPAEMLDEKARQRVAWMQVEGAIERHEVEEFDPTLSRTDGRKNRIERRVKRNLPRLPNGAIDFQWNRSLVKFREAVEMALRKPIDLEHEFRNRPVTVVQLDTGWSDHPKVMYEGSGYNTSESTSTIEIDGTDLSGRDPLQAGAFGMDSGHGVSTAATFIGTQASDQYGSSPDFFPECVSGYYLDDLVTGLFPYVNFVPIRIAEHVVFNFNIGEHSAVDMDEGVTAAVDRGADVITMSMGGEFFSDTMRTAARRAYRNGTIFVCAAGNNWLVDLLFGVVKPAEFPETIAVGGIEPCRVGDEIRYVPWRDGCDGAEVDVSAPAKYVYTAYKRFPGRSSQSNAYKFGGGTSQATVHVAAAASLWKYYFREELEDEWFASEGNRHRIVEAFRYGLSKSLMEPKHWKPFQRFRNKGILDVLELLNHSPSAYRSAAGSE